MARKYHGHVVATVLDLRTHMVEQMRELGMSGLRDQRKQDFVGCKFLQLKSEVFCQTSRRNVSDLFFPLNQFIVEQMRELGKCSQRSEKAGFCGLQVSAASI